MNKKFILIFTVLLLLTSFTISKEHSAYVSSEVVSEAQEEGTVDVIIKFKEPQLQKEANAISASNLEVKKTAIKKEQDDILKTLKEDSNFKLKRRYTLVNSISATITEKQIEMLRENPNVERVYKNFVYHAMLNDSVPLINASSFWKVNISNNYINGTGQVVCVIDTGVNYSHPALGGCTGSEFLAGNCEKVIAGYDMVNDDPNPVDDNGHGTHVAGIVASMNETYRGVAPGAKIVALKALNSAGGSVGDSVDASIEWCLNNSDTYNISVISMSLGTTEPNVYDSESACDAADPNARDLVKVAMQKNITVVAASGNEGNYTHISNPACLTNVTSVGAVYDADVGSVGWSACTDDGTEADNITCFSNAAPILDLLAPGWKIYSLRDNSGVTAYGGTSQATPHVAGAIALMNQFKKLENGSVLKPNAITETLKATGKNLTDPRNSLKFPRINLTKVLEQIDDTPRITFVQVLANNSNISQNHTFVNITTSEPLKNATIELDGASSTMSGSGRDFYYNITDRSDGSHNFTIHVTDSTGNTVNSGLYKFDVDTTKPNITDVANRTLLTGFIVYFNTSEPAYAELRYGTVKGTYPNEINNTDQLYVERHNISLTGLNSFTTYYYIVNATDVVGNSNITKEFNFTTGLIDLIAPSWSNNATYPITGTTTHNKSGKYQFNVTWQDNINISHVWIEHNFSGSSFNSSYTDNSSDVYYLNYTAVSAGKHFWRMYANDTSGNINYTDTFYYFVNKASSIVNLTLNNTESNRTINQTAELNITANTTGDHIILLYLNGTLINNNTKNVNNLTTFNEKGLYNITAKYPLSQNYTSSSKTYWVTVQDSLAPEVNITSPLNNTVYSSSPILNVSTNEVSNCNYTLNTGYNSTLSGSALEYTATLGLADGNYNISVICEDVVGFSKSVESLNFSVDSTFPEINITYPTHNLKIDTKQIQVNYTINESNFDRAWYLLNYNKTKIYLNPLNTSGGNNSKTITLRRSGKQAIQIYANDTAGLTNSKTAIFFLNRSLNITNWITDYINYEDNITSIEVFNTSHKKITNNVSIDQEVSFEINLTNVTMSAYNFSALNADWSFFFTVSDNSTYFESEIRNQLGTDPADYLYVANFTLFLNDTSDYYGKVRLPRNKSASYGNMYYCSKDDLTDCSVISTCSGEYTESDTTACYTEFANYTLVYVPHFSSIFGDNDTLGPEINITVPENSSIVTTSYNNNLVFSTNENSTCQYSINEGSWLSPSSSDNRYFTDSYNATSNTEHNITVNCTDSAGNLRSSRINFTINDTTAPTFSIGNSDTTDSITLTYTTNEAANHTIILGGTAKTNTNFVISHSAVFSDLSDDTVYKYNATSCDLIGNCRTGSGTERTDEETTTTNNDDSSGGGGASSTDDTITAPTTVSQIFYNPDEGQHTMSIASTNIAFTVIIFSLNKQVNGTVIMTVNKRDLPNFIEALPGKIYQYISVDKSIINEEDVSGAIVKFRVSKSWINNHNIDPNKVSLYRYKSSWNEISTVQTNDDSSYYYYEAESPGLSYFAIKGFEQEQVVQEQEEEQETPPTGDVIQDVSESDEQSGSEQEQSGGFPWIIIPFVFVGFIISGVVGFLLYQRNVSVLSDEELKELDQYVQKCKSEGVEFGHIKTELLRVGWPEYIVNLVLHDVHIPVEDKKRLITYIKKMKKAGKGNDEIRESLKRVGWQEEIIEEAFKSA